MNGIQKSCLKASGIVWFLSWFVICLEIFRWHHTTLSLRLNPPPAIPGLPSPRPGGFLITAIVTGVAALAIFVSLLILKIDQPTKEKLH